jgi:large subunit ribosomal protein L23
VTKELHLYDVLRRPVITEKSHVMAEQHNQYVFEVDLRANKIQIKQAVETIFDVNVVKVNTMVMPIKRGRRGRRF